MTFVLALSAIRFYGMVYSNEHTHRLFYSLYLLRIAQLVRSY